MNSGKQSQKVNNSDEISIQKNEIAEIDVSLLEKNKEVNDTIIKDLECDKKDNNQVIVNKKEKTINEEEKIRHLKKKKLN